MRVVSEVDLSFEDIRDGLNNLCGLRRYHVNALIVAMIFGNTNKPDYDVLAEIRETVRELDEEYGIVVT